MVEGQGTVSGFLALYTVYYGLCIEQKKPRSLTRQAAKLPWTHHRRLTLTPVRLSTSISVSVAFWNMFILYAPHKHIRLFLYEQHVF